MNYRDQLSGLLKQRQYRKLFETHREKMFNSIMTESARNYNYQVDQLLGITADSQINILFPLVLQEIQEDLSNNTSLKIDTKQLSKELSLAFKDLKL